MDTDTTLIKAVEPRTAWLAPMGYELDIDRASRSIKALLVEPKDPNATRFGTCEEAKLRIKMDLVRVKVSRKSKKMIDTLVKKFGE